MHCYKRIIFIFKQITLSDNNIKGKDKKFSESLKLKKSWKHITLLCTNSVSTICHMKAINKRYVSPLNKFKKSIKSQCIKIQWEPKPKDLTFVFLSAFCFRCRSRHSNSRLIISTSFCNLPFSSICFASSAFNFSFRKFCSCTSAVKGVAK